MVSPLVAVFVTSMLMQWSAAADWPLEYDPKCDPKWKSAYPEHSMCLINQPGTVLAMSAKDKKFAVDYHNKLRGQVGDTDAGGNNAAAMSKLYWDETIAQFAEKWAAGCNGGHDGGSQRYVAGATPYTTGQNAYSISGDSTNVTYLMESSITLYYEEVALFVPNGENSLSKVGHFTQVTAAKAAHVGCGCAHCPDYNNRESVYTHCSCNYAYGYNRIDNPYKFGVKGTDCPNSYKSDEGLCDCNGKLCYANGEIDLNTCGCTCAFDVPWLKEEDCSVDCDTGMLKEEDPEYCAEKKANQEGFCHSTFGNMYKNCPMTCNVCQKCNGQICQNKGTLRLATCQCECDASACTGSRWELDTNYDDCRCKDKCPDKVCDANLYTVDDSCQCQCRYDVYKYPYSDCQATVTAITSKCKDCKLSTKGQEYCGNVNTTTSGKTCQRWDSQSPYTHSLTDPSKFPEDTVSEAANYCRNPDSSSKPWCYTIDPNTRFEYCDISMCDFGLSGCENCKEDAVGAGYCGKISKTKEGLDCQRWDSQSPHTHSRTNPDTFPEATISDAANYCRNPDESSGGPWCYTTSGGTRSGYCNVHQCS